MNNQNETSPTILFDTVYQRFFPLTLHVILATLVIGMAVGAHAEGSRLLLQYSLNGLAAGLGITACLRVITTQL